MGRRWAAVAAAAWGCAFGALAPGAGAAGPRHAAPAVSAAVDPAAAVPAPVGGPDRFAGVESGSCWPDVVLVGAEVSCRFPLTTDTPEGDTPGAVWAVAGGGDVSIDRCRREPVDGAPVLVCRRIPVPAPGSVPVDLVDRYGRHSATLATARAVAGEPGVVAWTTTTVTFAGENLPFTVASRVDEPAWLLVLPEFAHRAVVTAIVPPAAPDAAGLAVTSVSLAVREPGHYRVVGCAGASATSCVREGVGAALHVLPARVREVIPGHNVAGADRIDILFAPDGFDGAGGEERFVTLVRTMLGFDGEPVLVGPDGRIPPGAGVDQVLIDARWGPFSMEPLRSNRDRFNVWYLPAEVNADGFAVAARDRSMLDPTRVGLRNPAPVAVSVGAPTGAPARSHAAGPSFSGLEHPSDEDLSFGAVSLVVPVPEGAGLPEVLAHELGHTLFDLRDEYDRRGTGAPNTGPPNCAPDRAVAEARWGDLVGAVDPFLDEWIEVETTYDPFLDSAEVRDGLVVGYWAGGCLASDASEAVRATGISLMRDERIGVFGSVNRRRVEQVLGWFSGRRAVTTGELPSAVGGLWCSPEAGVCGGTVAEWVDVTGIHLRVAGVEWRCANAVRTSRRPQPFSCRAPLPSLPSTTLVDLSVDGRSWSRPVLLAVRDGTAPDTTPPTAPATSGDAPATRPRSATGVWRATAVAVAAAAVCAGGVVGVRRRRGRSRPS